MELSIGCSNCCVCQSCIRLQRSHKI